MGFPVPVEITNPFLLPYPWSFQAEPASSRSAACVAFHSRSSSTITCGMVTFRRAAFPFRFGKFRLVFTASLECKPDVDYSSFKIDVAPPETK